MYRLVADPKICTSCRYCQLICSFVHEGVFSPEKARVRVIRTGHPALDFVIACKQCAKPPCGKACTENAISKNPSGLVLIDEGKCIRCGSCIDACPFGAIWMHPNKKVAIKCDQCGDCIRYCPPKTLRLIRVNDIANEKAESIAKQFSAIFPKSTG